MKMIKQIFLSDIKALCGNFFVLIIALGLCALPALYAWFNIYSNWDPYGNTGNLRIAVASDDKGFTDSQGKTSHAGEQVIQSLKENDSIHWVFTSSTSAKKRVDQGDCYAAILLPGDFSQNMYNGFRQGLKRPKITYYVNEKKNAVATKITDTAVSNLENSLNEMYISIVVSNVFTQEAQVADQIEEKQLISKLQDRIISVSDTISGYSNTLSSLQQANNKLSGTLDEAKLDIKALKEKAAASATKDSNLLSQIRKKNRSINQALSSASLRMEKAAATTNLAQKKTLYQKAMAQLEKARKEGNKLASSLKLVSLSNALAQKNNTLVNQLEQQITGINALKKKLNTAAAWKKEDISTSVESLMRREINTLQETYETVIVPFSEEVGELADTLESDTTNALLHIAQDTDLLQTIISGTSATLSSTNDGMASLVDSLHQITKKLDTLRENLNTLSDSELVQKITAFLQKDPEGYGSFFASPVKIKSERVYPVENYGAGVTPFYTTLAIWVGGIFLVSLIKVKPNPEKFPGAKPHELFLGRFLLFFLLGQLQTLIIVVGNLALLHTQCLLPGYFWLASALASFTFSLLIYTLTVSFGDIGKALIVVIVVIQIAGSSGTFPMEVLPAFYQKIHIFFPFPYAINAMRETICGMNGNDYLVYLLELLLFALAALMIGLVIRLPFQRLSHFVESRMEDTEMM